MDKMTLSDLKSYYNEWVTGTKSLQDIANAIYQQAGNADPTGVLSELVTADYGEFVRSGLIHMVILLTAYFEGTKEYIAPAQNAVDEIKAFAEPSANICKATLGRYRILTQDGDIVQLASETIWGMSDMVPVDSSTAYTFAAYDFYDLADWSELTTAADRPRFFIAFYDSSRALIDSVISVVPVIDTANHKSSYTVNSPGEAANAAFCIYHAPSDDDHAPDAISTATKLSITEGTAVPTQYIPPFTSTDLKARQRLDVLEADSFRDFTTDINNGQKSNNVDEWQTNGFVSIGFSQVIEHGPNDKQGTRICLIFPVKNSKSANQLWFNATTGEIFARRRVYNTSTPAWEWGDWKALLEFGNETFRDYSIAVAKGDIAKDADTWESNGFVIIGGDTEIENAPNSNAGTKLCLIFKPEAGNARAQLWFNGNAGEIWMRKKSQNADKTWAWRDWLPFAVGSPAPSENPKATFLGYTAGEVTPPVPHVGDRFRVMSYNVAKYTNDSDVSTSSKPFKCLGDSSDDGMKEKLSNFRQLLGEVDADVCLVQENRPYLYYPKKPLNDGDVMDISSNEKGIVAPTFNGLYQPKYQVRVGHTGVAVYAKSKVPGTASGSTVMEIGTVDGVEIPNLGYAYVTVAIGNRQVRLYSVHLTANTGLKDAGKYPTDEAKKTVRKMQLDRILALAASNAADTGLYVIGGDTNIRFDGERENFVELAKKYGCTLGNGGRFGWIGTKPDTEGPLDNIICGPGLALDNFSVLSEWKDLLYSDHLPVVADIIVPTEPIKLEVCTYNIGMFNAGKNDTPSTPLENVVEKSRLIDSFLVNNQFDILCMQEFSLNTKAESIGNTFRGHYDEKYIAAKQSTVCKYPFSGGTVSGYFTDAVGSDKRPYTIQVINVRGVKIAVMNVHLSWEGDAQSVRAAQRAEIISLLSDYNDAIIFGDFNANGDNGYAEFSDFTNAGMTVLNGSSGYTFPAKESSDNPSRVLDNIIIKGSRITGSNARVLTPLKMTGEMIPDEDQYYVSDHKPFAATLTIT